MECQIHRTCGACEFINQPYRETLLYKVERDAEFLTDFVKDSRFLEVVPSPDRLGYRSIFKLAVRPEPRKRAGRFRIALYQPGTHEIGPGMQLCPLHVPPLERLLFHLKDELEESPLQPYDEKKKTGDVKYLIARSNYRGDVILVIVTTRNVEAEARGLLKSLHFRGSSVEAAFMSIQAESSNAIFGKEMVPLTLVRTLPEVLNGLHFELGPTSFFQVNRPQASKIYKTIAEWAGSATKKEVAWDLYCGVGPISMHLAQTGYTVLGLEENKEAVFLAQKSATTNNFAHQTIFRPGKVEDSLANLDEALATPTLIVANPSRRGIHASARERLKELFKKGKTKRFAYLSCDVETLARDLKDLQSAGLKVESFQAFDLFAHTGQVEWLALGRVDTTR